MDMERILYRNLSEEDLFLSFAGLLSGEETGKERFYRCAGQLIEIGAQHGFTGNLWHTFLALLLVNHENAYSIACEKRREPEGSLQALVRHDLTLFRELFSYDFAALSDRYGEEVVRQLSDYQSADENGFVYNKRIRDRINELAKDLAAAESLDRFQETLARFYEQFGVGLFGLHKAFRIAHGEGAKVTVEPIPRIAHVQLSDLIGYESAKKKLIENTEAFVHGRPANNCILYGDAGTGKSSSIKAILNRYYDEGLRMIEVYKHEFQDLNDLIGILKNRNYRFIIYMDDLSFEEFEIEYKYLKAVIEGGLEKKPENILIYATSNRRHLIRENFTDRDEIENDIHKNATVQEKLSLVARFGVSIYFGAPEPKEFREIVCALAERNGIEMPREELLLQANQWELSHGGLSGRTATQFIYHLLGRSEE